MKGDRPDEHDTCRKPRRSRISCTLSSWRGFLWLCISATAAESRPRPIMRAAAASTSLSSSGFRIEPSAAILPPTSTTSA